MLRVFGDVNSGNCFKVKLLLHHLGLPYEWVHVDIMRKESRTPEFLRMNPKGQIPVLEIAPGNVLSESNAILHYLAEGTEFLPGDRLEHARVLQWMFFEQYNHEPSVASARFIVRYLGRPAEREELLQRKIADGYEALELMEQHLRSNAYLVGGRYSIADIALYAYTHVAHEGGFDLSRFPAIRAWLARIREQPRCVGMDA
jgi:glutathione S-transferase